MPYHRPDLREPFPLSTLYDNCVGAYSKGALSLSWLYNLNEAERVPKSGGASRTLRESGSQVLFVLQDGAMANEDWYERTDQG